MWCCLKKSEEDTIMNTNSMIAGPSSTSNMTRRRAPLKFHHIHGQNVVLTNNQYQASRAESFCKALAFSDRPIEIDEVVCMRFSEVKTNWSGVLRFGVTNTDPATFGDNLPKYACPDMTCKEGTWAKAMNDRYCLQGNIMYFFIRQNGEMFYGINGILKGLFLSGINTQAPMFVVVDIYGNTTSVEFVDEAAVPPLRVAREIQPKPPPVEALVDLLSGPVPQALPPPISTTPPEIPSPDVERQLQDSPGPSAVPDDPPAPQAVADCPPPDCPAPVARRQTPAPAPISRPTPTPVAVPERSRPPSQPLQTGMLQPVQELARELEQRLNFGQQQQRSLGANATAPARNTAPTPAAQAMAVPRRGFELAALTYNRNLPITPMQFHVVKGRTASFNHDRTIASRTSEEYCGGYVFTSRPLRVMEKVIIQIMGIENAFSGGLGFGVTNCDPEQLANFEWPDDADELINRQEFWAVNKDYEREPILHDELSYYLNERGEVVYQKNNCPPRILMHVDPSLVYYILFDIYGQVQTIRCVGTADARMRAGSPALPTIPQHRRRGPYHAASSGPPNRRPTNPPAAQSQTAMAQHMQTFHSQRTPLTVNMQQPDIPRRIPARNERPPSQPESSLMQIGQSSLLASVNQNMPPRQNDHPGRQQQQQQQQQREAPRPNRPPPPAPPQRMHSVPNTQQSCVNDQPNPANVSSQAAAPRPASTSTAASQENSGGAASTEAVLPDCSICMDQKCNSAVYPCGHLCMCYDCGRTTWSRQGVCPICRQQIKDILRVYPN